MSKSKLISPHGSDELKILLLEGKEREEELKKAETLPKITMTSRETGDLIFMGIVQRHFLAHPGDIVS